MSVSLQGWRVMSHSLQNNNFIENVYTYLPLESECCMYNKMLDKRALLELPDKSHTWRHFARIYKALEQIKAFHSYCCCFWWSQNDNNDEYDDVGDTDIVVYIESLQWKKRASLRSGIGLHLLETILSSFFIFNSYTKLFWNCDSRLSNLIVKAYSTKLTLPSLSPDLFKRIYAVLARIIPKVYRSAKQVLCNCLVSLHSEETGKKERCWEYIMEVVRWLRWWVNVWEARSLTVELVSSPNSPWWHVAESWGPHLSGTLCVHAQEGKEGSVRRAAARGGPAPHVACAFWHSDLTRE